MKAINNNAKKAISIIISITTLLSLFSIVTAKEYPQKFWDVSKDHWAFTYIADLADRGVINGYEDGSFKPERTVTRAEWSKIMVDAAGVQSNDNAVYFTDMKNHWANKYVNSAKKYLTGYTDGTFRPEQAAVREDVTVAMVRLKGYDLSDVDYLYLANFTDFDSISNYAKGYVAVAVQNNLISGFEDNTFRGQATLTRAEAATLLYRAFQHGNADKIVNTPTEPIVTDSPGASSGPSSTTENEYTQQAQPSQTTMSQNDNTENIEEIKPYKMETIAKLKSPIKEYYNYNHIAKSNDTLYYIDEDSTVVYKIDTVSGEKVTAVKAGDEFTVDGATGVIKSFYKVFYDSINDRVLASCRITAENDFLEDTQIDLLLDVSSKDVVMENADKFSTLITDYPIFYVDDDTSFWTYYRDNILIDQGSDNINDIENYFNYNSDFGYIYDCIEKSGTLYFTTEKGVCDQEMKSVLECSYTPIGINENGIFAISVKGAFVHTDFNGKKDFEITVSDIEIKDRKSFDIENIAYKMYINSKDEIIIYDIANSVLRKISVNTISQ